jgi:hypothetical protein
MSLELCSVDSDSLGLYLVDFEACGSHHAQIKGPVCGAATHENSATMILYGYDLV